MFALLGFYALCRRQQARIEGGVYYESLPSVEAWHADLDVALGDTWLDEPRPTKVLYRAGVVRAKSATTGGSIEIQGLETTSLWANVPMDHGRSSATCST